jgi:hypothetical protein
VINTSPEFERLNQARMQEVLQEIRELARSNNQQQQHREALTRLVTGPPGV